MTSGGDGILVLPRPLYADSSSGDIEAAIREAVTARLGPSACVGVTVRSQPRALAKGHVEAVSIALDGVGLEQLPLPGAPLEPDAQGARGRIEELRFDVTRLEVAGLVSDCACLVARQMDYALEVDGSVSRIRLSAVGDGEAELRIARGELVRTIERRVPAIRGLELTLRPGGRVEARGAVRTGVLSIRGVLSGVLGIENGTSVVLGSIDLRAGILGLPQAARQAVIRSVNPLIDVSALIGPAIGVRLDSIETNGEHITLSASLSPRPDA